MNSQVSVDSDEEEEVKPLDQFNVAGEHGAPGNLVLFLNQNNVLVDTPTSITEEGGVPVEVENIPILLSQTEGGQPLYIREYAPTVEELLLSSSGEPSPNFDGFSEASGDEFDGFLEIKTEIKTDPDDKDPLDISSDFEKNVNISKKSKSKPVAVKKGGKYKKKTYPEQVSPISPNIPISRPRGRGRPRKLENFKDNESEKGRSIKKSDHRSELKSPISNTRIRSKSEEKLKEDKSETVRSEKGRFIKKSDHRSELTSPISHTRVISKSGEKLKEDKSETVRFRRKSIDQKSEPQSPIFRTRNRSKSGENRKVDESSEVVKSSKDESLKGKLRKIRIDQISEDSENDGASHLTEQMLEKNKESKETKKEPKNINKESNTIDKIEENKDKVKLSSTRIRRRSLELPDKCSKPKSPRRKTIDAATTEHIEKTRSVSPEKTSKEMKSKEDEYIGPSCDKIGCTVSWLESGNVMRPGKRITNGIVYELDEFSKKIAWEKIYVGVWILRLLGYNVDEIWPADEDVDKMNFILKRRKALQVILSGKKIVEFKLMEFDETPFVLPSAAKLVEKKCTLQVESLDISKVSKETKQRNIEISNSTSKEKTNKKSKKKIEHSSSDIETSNSASKEIQSKNKGLKSLRISSCALDFMTETSVLTESNENSKESIVPKSIKSYNEKNESPKQKLTDEPNSNLNSGISKGPISPKNPVSRSRGRPKKVENFNDMKVSSSLSKYKNDNISNEKAEKPSKEKNAEKSIEKNIASPPTRRLSRRNTLEQIDITPKINFESPKKSNIKRSRSKGDERDRRVSFSFLESKVDDDKDLSNRRLSGERGNEALEKSGCDEILSPPSRRLSRRHSTLEESDDNKKTNDESSKKKLNDEQKLNLKRKLSKGQERDIKVYALLSKNDSDLKKSVCDETISSPPLRSTTLEDKDISQKSTKVSKEEKVLPSNLINRQKEVSDKIAYLAENLDEKRKEKSLSGRNSKGIGTCIENAGKTTVLNKHTNKSSAPHKRISKSLPGNATIEQYEPSSDELDSSILDIAADISKNISDLVETESSMDSQNEDSVKNKIDTDESEDPFDKLKKSGITNTQISKKSRIVDKSKDGQNMIIDSEDEVDIGEDSNLQDPFTESENHISEKVPVLPKSKQRKQSVESLNKSRSLCDDVEMEEFITPPRKDRALNKDSFISPESGGVNRSVRQRKPSVKKIEAVELGLLSKDDCADLVEGSLSNSGSRNKVKVDNINSNVCNWKSDNINVEWTVLDNFALKIPCFIGEGKVGRYCCDAGVNFEMLNSGENIDLDFTKGIVVELLNFYKFHHAGMNALAYRLLKIKGCDIESKKIANLVTKFCNFKSKVSYYSGIYFQTIANEIFEIGIGGKKTSEKREAAEHASFASADCNNSIASSLSDSISSDKSSIVCNQKNVEWTTIEHFGFKIPKFIDEEKVGNYCCDAGVDIEMLNSGENVDIAITNGIIIELLSFYKHHHAPQSALAYRLLKMKGCNMEKQRIKYLVSKMSTFKGKASYFSDSYFQTIANEIFLVAPGEKKAVTSSKVQQNDQSESITDKPDYREDEIDTDEELQSTRGNEGNITRGDVVYLYLNWLRKKNKIGAKVFVSDLQKDIESLMDERKVNPIRIPAGTLMSSSVKLHEEYNQMLADSPLDAKMYLEEDWLEDIQYLVSISRTKRNQEEELDQADDITDKNEVDTDEFWGENNKADNEVYKGDENYSDKDEKMESSMLDAPGSSDGEWAPRKLKKGENNTKAVRSVAKRGKKGKSLAGGNHNSDFDTNQNVEEADIGWSPRNVTLSKKVSPSIKSSTKSKDLIVTSDIPVYTEDDFEVEKILDYVYEKSGEGRRAKYELFYKVRWLGFGAEEDNWIPQSECRCPEILKQFWDDVERNGGKKYDRSKTYILEDTNEDQSYDYDDQNDSSSSLLDKETGNVTEKSFIESMFPIIVPNIVNEGLNIVTKRELLELYDDWREVNRNNLKTGMTNPLNVERFIRSVSALMERKNVTNFKPESILNACVMMTLLKSRMHEEETLNSFLDSSCLEVLEISHIQQKTIRKKFVPYKKIFINMEKESEEKSEENTKCIAPNDINQVENSDRIVKLQNDIERLQNDFEEAIKEKESQTISWDVMEEEVRELERAAENIKTDSNTMAVNELQMSISKIKEELNSVETVDLIDLKTGKLKSNVIEAGKDLVLCGITKQNIEGVIELVVGGISGQTIGKRPDSKEAYVQDIPTSEA